jgi:prepilin-type N-terminal cleavage/methylation domain-containing protein
MTMQNKNRSGYTLIELSVVLVIISLLTAGGLTLGAGMVNQAAHIDTGKILNQINQSLRDYYTVNGRLPCPAARDLAITDTNFGREVNGGSCNSTGAITGTSYSNDVRIGMIPVRALGLSDRAASDGNRILYAVTRQLTDASVFGASDGAVHVLPATGAEILDDAAYFVWSAGKDHKGAPLYTTAATPTTCSGTALDAENCDNDNIFRDAPFNNGEVVANFFDDHARWVPKFHLTAAESHSDSLWAANGDTNLYSVGTDSNTANTNVGIGTTAPQRKLHIVGNAGVLRLQGSDHAYTELYAKGAATRSGFIGYRSAVADDITVGNEISGGDIILEPTAGNVGINVTEPDAKLMVMDENYPVIRSVRTTTLTDGVYHSMALQQRTSGNMLDGFGAGLVFEAQDNAGVRNELVRLQAIRDGADDYGAFRILTREGTWGERMRVASSGRVGIGAGSDIRGALHVRGNYDFGSDGCYLGYPGSGSCHRNMALVVESTSPSDGGGIAVISTDDNADEYIIEGWNTVSQSQVFGVRANGRLIIKDHHDVTSANGGGAIILGTPDDYLLRIDPNEMQSSQNGSAVGFTINAFGGQVSIGSSSTGDANLRVNGTGTVCTIGNGSGNTACSSDRRLKNTIEPLENSLEKVAGLQGVSFEWNKLPGTKAIGLIAQDVEPLFPEVVTINEETGMKAISYASLVAPLIEAVKELDARTQHLPQAAAPDSAPKESKAPPVWLMPLMSFFMGVAGLLLGYRLARRQG